MQHSGGCLCGNVTITVTGQPYRVGICHCMDCRKFSGAPFNASAIFPRDALAVTGETREHKGRHSCPTCGSQVFAISGDEAEIALGTFDAPGQFTPTYELWTIRRESWLPSLGLRQYPRNRPTATRTEA